MTTIFLKYFLLFARESGKDVISFPDSTGQCNRSPSRMSIYYNSEVMKKSFCTLFGMILMIFPGSFFQKSLHSQDIPPLEFTFYDSAASTGYYFMIPYRAMPPFTYDHPQLIVDSAGRIVFYRIIPGTTGVGTSTLDFKVHPNGVMSYWSPLEQMFFFMDSTFTVIDSLKPANGFETDPHEMLITSDNHYVILAKETRIMNLSGYYMFGINHNQPGSSNAEVMGAVIQEFDENKNLVWEWKAHDHLAFGDVNELYLSNANRVDWTHSNAIDRDTDGNYLMSMRHFDEIIKINRQTGAVIWRFGGNANQFTITGDPVGFSGQHDVRRAPNGNLTLMDNGQYNNYEMARGVEYSLNEIALTANLVWEFIYDSAMFSTSLGSHRTMNNGCHLIDYGTNQEPYPWMVLVKPDKSVAMELECPNSYTSYRVYNYPSLPWQLPRPLIECVKSGTHFLLQAEPGHPQYHWSTGATTQSIPVADTGLYWVYVPYGDGYLSSEPFLVDNLADPCHLPTQVYPAEMSRPSLQINPNPARESAVINFTVPENLTATLKLTTMTGVQVDAVPGHRWSSGRHSVVLETSRMPQGVYFLILTLPEDVLVAKLLVQ